MSRPDAVEFFVQARMHDRAGTPVVVGFVSRGRPLVPGDVFLSAYEVPRTADDARQMRPSAAPVNRRAVALTVVAIDVSRTQVDALHPGVAGALYLGGEGLDDIGIRTHLCTSVLAPA
jgi:hypothetical protein